MRSINISRLKKSILFTVKMAMALAYLVVLLSFIISYLFLRTISFTSWLHTILIFSLILFVVGGVMIMTQAGYWKRMYLYFKQLLSKFKQAEEEQEVIDKEGKDIEINSPLIKKRDIHASTIVMTASGGFLALITLFINVI